MRSATDTLISTSHGGSTAETILFCAEMEADTPLDVADMTEAELIACAMHDPDIVTRRRALVRYGATQSVRQAIAMVPVLRECRDYIAGGAGQWGKTSLLASIDAVLGVRA